jgi:hypothetical protein
MRLDQYLGLHWFWMPVAKLSHLKMESLSFPIGLVFWGDCAFHQVGALECGTKIAEYGAKIADVQQEALVAL